MREVKYKNNLKKVITAVPVIAAFALLPIMISGEANTQKETVVQTYTKDYKEELSEVMSSGIDYNEIANYIAFSDNPELALYTLYNEYEMSGDERYTDITNQTCKFLTFETNDKKRIFTDYDFDEYLQLNGYSSREIYAHEAKNEIYFDAIDGSNIDFTKVHVKKLSYKIK